MNIYIINKSTVLTDNQIIGWMPSFSKFVGHVRAYWPRPTTLLYVPAAMEPPLAWKLIFADTSDEAGALGYHDFTADGRPISYVFAKDDITDGYSPTVTATHELAEMIADPWISEAFQVSNEQFYAKEIADPCEADLMAYEIDGVLCSDFVTPKWFIPNSTGVLDHARHIDKPLELLGGGYMSVFTSGQGWTQIYAQSTGQLMSAEKAGLAKANHGYSRLVKYGRNRGIDNEVLI